MRTAGVNTDIVAGNGVAYSSAAADTDTIPPIARDDVAFAVYITADGVVLSVIEDFDSILRIAQVDHSAGVNADIVAGDGIAHRAIAVNTDTIPSIARDNVPLPGCVATDSVVLCAIGDYDPILIVAQNCRTYGVGTDVIAGDGIIRRAVASDVDAILRELFDHQSLDFVTG